MNKIYSLVMMALTLLAFSACESDRDSNPTLLEPTSFVLNVPPYAANNVYDLQHSKTVEFTCSQPAYGFPISVTYTIQICLKDTFVEADTATGTKANYVTLSSKYTSAKMDVDASELALALVDLWKDNGKGDFPTTPIPLYVRAKAIITSTGGGECTSNVIKLPQVLPYKAEPAVTAPTTMYMIGSFEGANSWANWLNMYSVTETPGMFWRVQYFKSGDLMKFNMADSWEGHQVGYSDGLVPDASKTLADVSGADDGNGGYNIKIGKAGWYTVVVTAKVSGKSLAYTLNFYPVQVAIIGSCTGLGDNAWKEASALAAPTCLFTAPDGPGDFTLASVPASGDLRIFAKIPDTDWWRSEFVVFNDKLEYRENRGELGKLTIATNASAGQTVKVNFITATGSVK